MSFLRAAVPRRHLLPRLFFPISASLILVLSLSACRPARLLAQNIASAPDDDVIRVHTDLVTVPVFVADAHGHRVFELTQADFAVRNDGRLVAIKYFATGAARVALLFALDDSGSTREIIARQSETALALFSRFGVNSRVAVLTFAEHSELTLSFTNEIERARDKFRLVAQPNHQTAIFDAALAAVRAYDSSHVDQLERRIVILLSDGLDTSSATPAPDVIGEARRRGVSFYVIHFPLYTPRDDRLMPRRAAKGFRELAEQTGGHYFLVGDASASLDPHAAYDLAPVYRAIAEDLQSQYVIGYYPDAAARDSRYHRIEVNLTSPANRRLRVQTLRGGYILKQ